MYSTKAWSGAPGSELHMKFYPKDEKYQFHTGDQKISNWSQVIDMTVDRVRVLC
jgi:hypothetical protein